MGHKTELQVLHQYVLLRTEKKHILLVTYLREPDYVAESLIPGASYIQGVLKQEAFLFREYLWYMFI